MDSSLLPARCVAVLIHSLTHEIFNPMILEAYMRGSPVMVLDLGPLREIVEKSVGGLPYRNDAELKEALARFRRSAELRWRLGAKRLHDLSRWAADGKSNIGHQPMSSLLSRPHPMAGEPGGHLGK